MKSTLEDSDISAIASAVAELIRPLLAGNGKAETPDKVFDKRTLSEYLLISSSTISKMVMNKQIPYFKIQQGQSGGVRFYKKDIDKWVSRQTIPELTPFTGVGKIRP